MVAQPQGELQETPALHLRCGRSGLWPSMDPKPCSTRTGACAKYLMFLLSQHLNINSCIWNTSKTRALYCNCLDGCSAGVEQSAFQTVRSHARFPLFLPARASAFLYPHWCVNMWECLQQGGKRCIEKRHLTHGWAFTTRNGTFKNESSNRRWEA